MCSNCCNRQHGTYIRSSCRCRALDANPQRKEQPNCQLAPPTPSGGQNCPAILGVASTTIGSKGPYLGIIVRLRRPRWCSIPSFRLSKPSCSSGGWRWRWKSSNAWSLNSDTMPLHQKSKLSTRRRTSKGWPTTSQATPISVQWGDYCKASSFPPERVGSCTAGVCRSALAARGKRNTNASNERCDRNLKKHAMLISCKPLVF